MTAQDESNGGKCYECSSSGCDSTFDPSELGGWGGSFCSTRTYETCDQTGCTALKLCRTEGDCGFLANPPTNDPGSGPTQRQIPSTDYPVSSAVLAQVAQVAPLLAPFLTPLGSAGKFRGTIDSPGGTTYRYKADLSVDDDSAVLVVNVKQHPEILTMALELWSSGRSAVLQIKKKGAAEDVFTFGD